MSLFVVVVPGREGLEEVVVEGSYSNPVWYHAAAPAHASHIAPALYTDARPDASDGVIAYYTIPRPDASDDVIAYSVDRSDAYNNVTASGDEFDTATIPSYVPDIISDGTTFISDITPESAPVPTATLPMGMVIPVVASDSAYVSTVPLDAGTVSSSGVSVARSDTKVKAAAQSTLVKV